MNKKRQEVRRLRTRQRIVVVALVVGVLIFGGVWLASRLNPGSGTGLRDSDTAFSVPDHVGQPAPAFSSVNVDGQPYKLTPGDGRAKAIVFYMGYG
jgi:hypothetical protein